MTGSRTDSDAFALDAEDISAVAPGSSAAVPVATEPSASPNPKKSIWSRVGFVFVNLWLVYHVYAITIAPASVGPSSRLEQGGWRLASPYVQLLYLNHGYHYFAPEPAGCTLIAYEAELPNGTKVSGRLPHRDIAPRLLYHRHLMLTEFLGNASPELTPRIAKAYAMHLGRVHGAKRVTLSKVFHELPAIDRIRAGGTLLDPASYVEQPLGTFECPPTATP